MGDGEGPTSTPIGEDRDRWNERYRAGGPDRVPLLLERELDRLPRAGLALDVAGGSGAAAVVLARRGLDVTLADVSDVALDRAVSRAAAAGVTVTPLHLDLTSGPFPVGPWDVITCFDYLDRRLFPAMADQLRPDGVLLVSVATRTNLERHRRPGARYLLDDGELPGLLAPLEPVVAAEGWNDEGRHVADAVARRP